MSVNHPSVFESNRTGHIFQAIVSAIVLAVSSWLYAIEVGFANIPKLFVFSVLYVLIGVSVIILLLSILRLLKPIPELKYSEEGFDCKVGTSTLIHIPWAEVDDLAFVSEEKEQVLAIILKNPASVIRQSRGWAATVLRARLKNYRTPIILSAKRLNISLEDLKLGFVHHWNQYRHD